VSSVASARIARRDPAAVRRTLRFVALVRAGARFLPDGDAREIARTLLGQVECGGELTRDDVAQSVDRRRAFGWFPESVMADAVESIFDAWRSVTA
jgi:hypothetical protein